MTSKLVMPTVDRWLKALAGQRSSGVTEMEKKPPLSATMAPYFFKASRMAFSCLAQVAGMTKLDFKPQPLAHGRHVGLGRCGGGGVMGGG